MKIKAILILIVLLSANLYSDTIKSGNLEGNSSETYSIYCEEGDYSLDLKAPTDAWGFTVSCVENKQHFTSCRWEANGEVQQTITTDQTVKFTIYSDCKGGKFKFKVLKKVPEVDDDSGWTEILPDD